MLLMSAVATALVQREEGEGAKQRRRMVASIMALMVVGVALVAASPVVAVIV